MPMDMEGVSQCKKDAATLWLFQLSRIECALLMFLSIQHIQNDVFNEAAPMVSSMKPSRCMCQMGKDVS